MPTCQRVFRDDFPKDTFAVTDISDEQRVIEAGARLCGKPAFYKQVSEEGDVVIWICVECFNEFEARFGEGSWTDVSRFAAECGEGENNGQES
jgi:hypothetical protein